jgi:hypothetical protein
MMILNQGRGQYICNVHVVALIVHIALPNVGITTPPFGLQPTDLANIDNLNWLVLDLIPI